MDNLQNIELEQKRVVGSNRERVKQEKRIDECGERFSSWNTNIENIHFLRFYN